MDLASLECFCVDGKSKFQTSVWELGGGWAGLPAIPVPRRWESCNLASLSSSVCQLWAQLRHPASMNKVQNSGRRLRTPALGLHMRAYAYIYSWAHLKRQCAPTLASMPVHIQASTQEKKIMINRKQKRSPKQDSKLNYTSQIHTEISGRFNIRIQSNMIF